MRNIDSFQFKTTEKADHDYGPYYSDYTPYDDVVPKEFRAEEPAPPPFDTVYPDNSDAMNLIDWAFEQIA